MATETTCAFLNARVIVKAEYQACPNGLKVSYMK